MGKIGGIACGIALAALAGCAAPVPTRPAGASAGSGGSSGTVVFPDDPSILLADASAPEFARRDAALGFAGDVRQPADLWPGTAPSVDRVRYLYLNRTAETTVILRQRQTWSWQGPSLYTR